MAARVDRAGLARPRACRCSRSGAIEPDTWGLPEPWRSERLAYVPVLERAAIAGAGHFVHIEQPRETAALVLGFLGRA